MFLFSLLFLGAFHEESGGFIEYTRKEKSFEHETVPRRFFTEHTDTFLVDMEECFRQVTTPTLSPSPDYGGGKIDSDKSFQGSADSIFSF